MKRLHSLLALAAVATFVYACASGTDPGEDLGTTGGAVITGATIVSRAEQWVNAKLAYCQSPNHAHDSDPSCSSTCNRTSNPAWDPYRSDCSGFVSWSWALGSPGLDTSEFAPGSTSVSYTINGSTLQPGDALNIPGEHIILFVGWQTPGSVATFYEEPGCSVSQPYAHAFTSSVSINGDRVYVSYEGKTFYAIRYTGVAVGGTGSSKASSSTAAGGHGASSGAGSSTTSPGGGHTTSSTASTSHGASSSSTAAPTGGSSGGEDAGDGSGSYYEDAGSSAGGYDEDAGGSYYEDAGTGSSSGTYDEDAGSGTYYEDAGTGSSTGSYYEDAGGSYYEDAGSVSGSSGYYYEDAGSVSGSSGYYYDDAGSGYPTGGYYGDGGY